MKIFFLAEGQRPVFDGSGEDNLKGHSGKDQLFCGEGVDIFSGGNGADIVNHDALTKIVYQFFNVINDFDRNISNIDISDLDLISAGLKFTALGDCLDLTIAGVYFEVQFQAIGFDSQCHISSYETGLRC